MIIEFKGEVTFSNQKEVFFDEKGNFKLSKYKIMNFLEIDDGAVFMDTREEDILATWVKFFLRKNVPFLLTAPFPGRIILWKIKPRQLTRKDCYKDDRTA